MISYDNCKICLATRKNFLKWKFTLKIASVWVTSWIFFLGFKEVGKDRGKGPGLLGKET